MSSVVIGITPLAIPLVLAAGLVAGAVACAQILSEEYQRARLELDEQLATEQARRDAIYTAKQKLTAESQELVALTHLTAAEDAASSFLRNGLHRLSTRLDDLPDIDPNIPVLLQELERSFDQNPDLYATYVEQFYRLSAAITAAASRRQATTETPQDDCVAQAAMLREMISSPLLASQNCASLREEITIELARVEQLPTQERKVRQQCYHNLIRRVKEEISEQAKRQQQRLQSARAFRERLCDVRAKLTAVAALHDLPEYVRLAESLRSQLAQQLANLSLEHLEVFDHLARQADELFNQAPQAMEALSRIQAMHQQLSDVLVTMGYTVTTIPDESAGVVSMLMEVDADTGIQVSLDSQGRFVSEMVAMREETAKCRVEIQEKVCTIVDDMLEHLRARGSHVKVKARKTRKSGEILRVVAGAEMQEQSRLPQAEEAARLWRIGE